MRITLIDAGKRFNRDWIFRHLSYEFNSGQSYAITGPNGSGKSTLLQVIGGAVAPSEGKFEYASGHPATVIPPEEVYKHISLAAPYLDLIEEMTLLEFLDFHRTFKPFLPGVDSRKIISILGLDHASGKQIRYFSSGMKQRVKLAQAIFSATPLLLLDEPCTNLDADGIALYQGLIRDYCGDRLVIVSSNDPQEYSFCNHVFDIKKFK